MSAPHLHQQEKTELHLKSDSVALNLHYQLQYDLKLGTAISAEALLRSRQGPYANGAPLALIEEAERSGTMADITLWVVNQALNDFPELHSATGIERIAVNISPSDIVRYDLVDNIAKLLGRHKIPGYCLEIEITERLPVTHIKRTINNIKALSSLGVHVVLDDFGAGYAGLPMLIDLPVKVKCSA